MGAILPCGKMRKALQRLNGLDTPETKDEEDARMEELESFS
jgi:hypothetical protein